MPVNAGAASMNHALLTPAATIERLLAINVRGTMLCSREAAKQMIQLSPEIPDEVRVDLGPGDLELPRGVDVHVQDVQPRSVAVQLDSTFQRVVPVRAVVANPDGLLRPGMAAYARVLTEPASALWRLARAPVRATRLAWWRFWS